MKKIYLSTKDHLKKNGKEIFQQYRQIAANYGFELMEVPDEFFQLSLSPQQAMKLAQDKLDLIRQCDIMIIDTSDFRCDNEPFGESSFEFGIAAGLKKACYCYMSDTRSHVERYTGTTHLNESGRIVDENGAFFEHDALNLMLYYSAVSVIEGNFEDCIKQIKE